MSAKLRIEQLLTNDPERDWGCSEMAIELQLTVRTIARVIGELTREGRVYRSYGRRRRMAFRHAPPVELPRWLMAVQLVDLDNIPVARKRIHLLDDDEPA